MSKINFPATLRWLRKQAGLTQTELAARLHIGQSTIASYETGIREPSFKNLEKLADLFCITPGDLINGLNGGKA